MSQALTLQSLRVTSVLAVLNLFHQAVRIASREVTTRACNGKRLALVATPLVDRASELTLLLVEDLTFTVAADQMSSVVTFH